MVSPDNDPVNLRLFHPDGTGVSSPLGNEAVPRAYNTVGTDKQGQFIHNTIGDPAGDPDGDPVVPAIREDVREHDVYVDITPAEEA
jgi:hypothetical protein